VKVIDFGIAKARDRVAGETSTGSLKGKIQFMAPEQAIGKPIDRRADVWAAGAVLYSLLGGQPPYDGPNQFATLHQIASGEPPPRLPARVPQAIAEIAYRALLHDPDGRFATAAEMQRALEAAMVSTKNAAASADVAAFAGEHLSSRAEQRKKSVDMAIRAATERARVERILTTPDSSSNPVRVAADVQIDEEIIPFPSTRSQVATLPERAPPPDNDALLKLVATSPSLRASSSPLIGAPPLASHRRAVLSAVAVAITVVAAAVVSLRPRHAPSAEDPAPTAASAPIFEAIPAPSIAPTDVASPSPSAPPSPPSAATSALAAPAITHAPDAHRASSPRRPAPPPASASAKSPARPAPKERIDDGF
jgi:serine/threonine protein kinase